MANWDRATIEIESSIALNIPQPLKGFWQGAKYIPIAPKYQWTGTIRCNSLESCGLRDGAAVGGKSCLGCGRRLSSLPTRVYNGFTKGLQRVYRGDWPCERFVAGYGWQLHWQWASSSFCKDRCSPRPPMGARPTGKPSKQL